VKGDFSATEGTEDAEERVVRISAAGKEASTALGAVDPNDSGGRNGVGRFVWIVRARVIGSG
jgi:hypothetical protein